LERRWIAANQLRIFLADLDDMKLLIADQRIGDLSEGAFNRFAL
jgi:hypothetical protein